jgi:hypothetical protein
MAVLLIAIVIGLIPAAFAAAKGRNFVAWWIYGSALFIIALPHALLMKPDEKALAGVYSEWCYLRNAETANSLFLKVITYGSCSQICITP